MRLLFLSRTALIIAVNPIDAQWTEVSVGSTADDPAGSVETICSRFALPGIHSNHYTLLHKV